MVGPDPQGTGTYSFDPSTYHDGGGSAGVTGTTSTPTSTGTTGTTAPVGGTTPPATTNANGMTTSQQSAYDALAGLFASYGLPSDAEVMAVLKQAAINGDSPDLVQIALQGTAAWKTRFAGNEQRRAAGLNVLSVAEYLEQENQYASIMRNAGLPQGFFDDPTDFATFIGKSISPAEIQDRVNLASDIVNREDPAVVAELQRRGLSQGMVIAHALDPERAAPLIKRELTSVLIGAAAVHAGITTGVDYADQLASRGINEQQAQQGFGQVADISGNATKLGSVYGIHYGQSDAQDEVFNQDVNATNLRKRITGQERSNFAGSATYGVNKTSTAGGY